MPPASLTPNEALAPSSLADLCHRVRTPLNAVLGSLELLLDGDLSPADADLARAALVAAVELHQVFESEIDGRCAQSATRAGASSSIR